MLRNTKIHIKYTMERTASVDNISETLLRNCRGFLLYWQQEIRGWRVIMLCKCWCAKARVQHFIARALKCYGILPTALYSKTPLPVFLCRKQRGPLLLWTISLSQLSYQIIMPTGTHIYLLLRPIYIHRSQVILRTLKDKNMRDTISSYRQSLSLVISFPQSPAQILSSISEGREKEGRNAGIRENNYLHP